MITSPGEPTGKAVTVTSAAPAVALVTIARPEARNAINRDVVAQLSAVLAELESDDGVRVVILTGTGTQAFCAGADLREAIGADIFDLFTRRGAFAGFTHAARRKPWIAAVNGPAVAGGCEIALACDLIIASQAASFSLPEPRRGLIAGAGGIYRLRDALPPKLAAELLLTGNAITAARAAEFGMVNYAVPAEQVLTTSLELANAIIACAPGAVTATLEVLHSERRTIEAPLQQVSEALLASVTGTGEFGEGVAAFLEKREPNWAE